MITARCGHRQMSALPSGVASALRRPFYCVVTVSKIATDP